ncbi:hypothetical protein E2C01_060584 [Portunus trituberculatus]|uniref:Uncharacterized protein n=1 Tax=Portunus trituberculatus TaxID=210409 RepID=A0A5B7HAW5_PORTR|nr:hypothetical protein [Portunus trituberculatus]
MMQQQHKLTAPITFEVGYMVMVQVPPREPKLSPKFMAQLWMRMYSHIIVTIAHVLIQNLFDAGEPSC